MIHFEFAKFFKYIQALVNVKRDDFNRRVYIPFEFDDVVRLTEQLDFGLYLPHEQTMLFTNPFEIVFLYFSNDEFY